MERVPLTLSVVVLGVVQAGISHAVPLAEVISSGGLRPDPYPMEWGLRIEEDGTVLSFEDDQTKELATLSQETLEKFRKKIAGIETTDMLDTNPNDPPCTDVPS